MENTDVASTPEKTKEKKFLILLKIIKKVSITMKKKLMI